VQERALIEDLVAGGAHLGVGEPVGYHQQRHAVQVGVCDAVDDADESRAVADDHDTGNLRELRGRGRHQGGCRLGVRQHELHLTSRERFDQLEVAPATRESVRPPDASFAERRRDAVSHRHGCPLREVWGRGRTP
jgi:hypothetical protein